MSRIKEIAEGLTVFSKKEYKTDVSFEHDVIRVLVQDEVTGEDEKRLIELNWGFDSEENDDWYHF